MQASSSDSTTPNSLELLHASGQVAEGNVSAAPALAREGHPRSDCTSAANVFATDARQYLDPSVEICITDGA